ncbi:trypsin-like peptidase domain-containing protein [Blastopirellula retiformator]|uniref:Serine protease n=1 Tax=Blastopirellula retiformator TaxID=2527970 RepID=A0A5C5VKQ7_9BACT|nr:trypsin-like peptidase domain-containing protein [Blastopirellula retiformator]TWT38510.1 hypothetical protein Enr8_02030 [Blastopirellula retiformator]
MLVRLIAVLAVLVYLCYNAPVLAAEDRPDRWESPFFIRSIVDKEGKKIGKASSGFLVRRGEQVYLATARHVSEESSADSIVSFSIGDSSVNVKLADLGLSSENPWLTKPSYDVTVLPVSHKLLAAAVAVPLENCRRDLPPARTTLEVVGFPMGLGVQGPDLSPIVMEAKLASGEINDPFKQEGQRIVVCVPALADGSSGSPVFASIEEDRWRLIGAHSGNLIDSSGGKLAKFVPAHALIDLVEDHAASEKTE